MSTREALNLKAWVYWHNLALSVGSGLLLLALAGELIRLHLSVGYSWQDIYCPRPEDRTDGFLYFLYYINYLFKCTLFVSCFCMITCLAFFHYYWLLSNEYQNYTDCKYR